MKRVDGLPAGEMSRRTELARETVVQSTTDIDLLVEMDPERSLLDLVGLWQDLEDMLGSHVGLLSERGVSPHLRDRIYADAIAL